MAEPPCPSCGQPNLSGKRFCRHCGAALPRACPSCGAAVLSDARFCDDCGAPLASTASQVAPPVPTPPEPAPLGLGEQLAAFQRALPPSVQQQVFVQEQGENRVLTILFADLTGSVARTAGLHPEDAAVLVDQVLKAMVDAILTYEGRINRLLGDAVLAFFGTPLAHENDPERAILAALALRESVQKMGLNVTAGINTGEVYLGAIGAEQHREVTAQGPAVNLAARLREKARPGQILVGESVYRHTRRAFAFARQEVEAKGFAEPVAAYEVVRALPHPEKVRGIEGLRAALVGREKELAGLGDALAAVRAGRGQIVTIIGEAGVGKSRLIAELKELALAPVGGQPRPLWLEGRCLDVGMAVSYWPFLDLLRAHFAFRPEDDDRARGARISTAVAAPVGQGDLAAGRAEEMLPLLGHLLGARFGSELDERLKTAGPEQIKHQTFLALVDLFVALARRQPLILVLEDLHWADSLSLDLVSLLMESLRLAPLLLICVYRPEQEHKCWHLGTIATRKCHERFTEIHLKELTAAQSRRLVESLLHIEALPASVKEQILGRAQGNPFFVEEVVRSLIDADLVYHDGAVWRARAEIAAVAVPESIQSVILSRVDRLEAEAKHVLQSASVIGRLFRRRLLEHLAQQETELDRALAELEDRQLIYEERAIPEEEYSFHHVLAQETVYHNILRRRRVVFHQQVAEAMEALYRDNLDEYHEQLAYHYEQSEAHEKAVEYLLKAGEKSRRAYLNEAAIGYFRRALARLEALPPGRTRQEWEFAALQGLGQTYTGAANAAEAEEPLRRAIALAREMDLDSRAIARLYWWLGEVLWWQDRYDEMAHLGEQGLTLLGTGARSVEVALMHQLAASGYQFAGTVAEQREHRQRIAQLLPGLPHIEELRDAYGQVVQDHIVEKRVEEAQHWVAIFEQAAQQYHDLPALGELHAACIPNLLYMTGDVRGTAADLQTAVDIFDKIGAAGRAQFALLFMAFALLWLGDIEPAEERLRGILDSTTDGMKQDGLGLTHAALGITLLCRAGPREGTEALKKAARLVHGEPHLHVALGRAHLAQGRSLEARANFETAVTFAMGREPFGSVMTAASFLLAAGLGGLEEIAETPESFRALVDRLRVEHPGAENPLPAQPWLERVEAQTFTQLWLHEGFAQALTPAWSWQDPFGDCSYAVQQGLHLQAANGRGLWHINLSAPRLLRPAPTGDLAVQAICRPASAVLPAIGGLLLWKDRENYLVLERGLVGPADICFRGCLGNKDVLIGRGRLPAERLTLRLERRGGRVQALCSADSASWLSAGSVEFPVADPVEVGVHAIGAIDRAIYHGAYPDGAALRFDSFEMWGA